MSEQKNQHKYSRRDFLKAGAGLAGAGLLSACAPAAPPAPEVIVETVEVPVVETVEVPVEKIVEALDPWLTGLVSPDAIGDFDMTSWEGEGEMRKWLLHVGKFFSKYYPNMEWNLDWGVDWVEYWTKLPTLLAGGTPLEMVWMHDSRVHTFASRDLLLPLDDLLANYPTPDWPDRFYPSQVEAFVHDGKQYAFPYDWAPGAWYVNLDILEEAGVDVPTEDWTWDDTLEAALKMTKFDANGNPTQWGLGGLTVFAEWTGGFYWIIKSFGGDFWTPDLTKSMMADPKTIEGFQFLRDLMWEHKVVPSAAGLSGMGLGEEFAFVSGLVGLSYGLNDVSFRFGEAIGDKFRWTVAPTPTGPAGRFQFSGGSAFAIPKTSRQPDMAYELIRYVLANPDNLPTTAVMGGALVGHMDFAEFGLPSESSGIRDAFQHAFVEMGAKDPCYPNYHEKYQEWEYSVYAPAFGPIWAGELEDASVACQEADEGTQKILDSMAA